VHSLFGVLIPVLIIGLGLLMITRGFRSRGEGGISWGTVCSGLGICAIGALFFYLPFQVLLGVILGILALWGFASAGVALLAVRKGRAAIPSGFYQRLGLGLISLAFSILIFVAPAAVVRILILILGIVAFLLGIVLIVNGVRIWASMKESTDA
jgi:uncharacterized membrane protein HdeD (DUF308 family)